MRRLPAQPRAGWQKIVADQGLVFHSEDEQTYWDESAYYEFSAAEIDTLEEATDELHARCLDAARHVIERGLLGRIGIPEPAHEAIRWSWLNQERSLYGRFDLGYDGIGPPKLLEYNADTPTMIVESAVAQWYWLQDKFPEADQFNSLWEALVARWRELAAENLGGERVYFTSGRNDEDWMTISLLRDTASEAGLATEEIFVADIGWNTERRMFVDKAQRSIDCLFKLYPWEWMLADPFGRYALDTYGRMRWIEPVWKLVLSCKGILPVLWELFSGHPNLLPCFAGAPGALTRYAAKPLFSREGANVRLVDSGQELAAAPGVYGDQPRVFQQLYDLPSFGGNHPVIGSWIVGGAAHGMGIRESCGLITDVNARFVPHLFR